jgi:hypothetical protein
VNFLNGPFIRFGFEKMRSLKEGKLNIFSLLYPIIGNVVVGHYLP